MEKAPNSKTAAAAETARQTNQLTPEEQRELARVRYEMSRNIMLETALTALALGAVGAFSLALVAHAVVYTGSAAELSAGVYVLVVHVAFHVAEFIVATVQRPHDAHVDAFMVFHSKEFMIANALAWAEFALERALVPDAWKPIRLTAGGSLFFAALTLGFYLVRVVAMVQCGANFSLQIETSRRDTHRLVDRGLYSVLRHPAYFGWFWRTVFSQLILMNPICLLLHTAVTWKFFRNRIPFEERAMLQDSYFGQEYAEYKKRTHIGIPFIPS